MTLVEVNQPDNTYICKENTVYDVVYKKDTTMKIIVTTGVNKIKVRTKRERHIHVILVSDMVIGSLTIYLGSINMDEFTGRINMLDIFSLKKLHIPQGDIDTLRIGQRPFSHELDLEVVNDDIQKIIVGYHNMFKEVVLDCLNLSEISGYIQHAILHRSSIECIDTKHLEVMHVQPDCKVLYTYEDAKVIKYFPNPEKIIMKNVVLPYTGKVKTLEVKMSSIENIELLYELEYDELYLDIYEIKNELHNYFALDMIECEYLRLKYISKLELRSLFNYLPRAKMINNIPEDDYDKYFEGLSYRSFKKSAK